MKGPCVYIELELCPLIEHDLEASCFGAMADLLTKCSRRARTARRNRSVRSVRSVRYMRSVRCMRSVRGDGQWRALCPASAIHTSMGEPPEYKACDVAHLSSFSN